MMFHRIPRGFGFWALAALVLGWVVAMPQAIAGQVGVPEGRDARAETIARAPHLVLSGPGGVAVAHLVPGATVEILQESGDGLRVRIEGWIARNDMVGIAIDTPNLRLSDVRAEPDRYAGAMVRWRVQHISVQRADSLRSDMPRGEPYLLARDPGGEAGLVYALVPPDLLSMATNLAPLQRVEIVGRIVFGRSPLTGHPILELLEIRP
jgi:hypothetical protein